MGFNPYKADHWTEEALLAEWKRLEAEWGTGVDINQVSAGDTSTSMSQRLTHERRMELIGRALCDINPDLYANYCVQRVDRTIACW
jgi:hypothetical protein